MTQYNIVTIWFGNSMNFVDHGVNVLFAAIATNDGIETSFVDYHVESAGWELHISHVHLLEHKLI